MRVPTTRSLEVMPEALSRSWSARLGLALLVLLCWLPVIGAAWAVGGGTGSEHAGWRGGLGFVLTLFGKPQVQEMWIVSQRAVVSTGIAFVLGLLVTGAVARLRGAMRHGVTILALLPLLIPDALRAFAWSRLLADDSPVLGALFSRLGGSPRFGEWALIGSLAASVVPLMVATLVAVLRHGDDSSWLAAAETCPNKFVFFRRLVVQSTLPAWPIALLAGFVFAANASAEEMYLGGAQHSTSIQKVASALVNLDPGYLGAFGICLLGCAVLLTLIAVATVLYLQTIRTPEPTPRNDSSIGCTRRKSRLRIKIDQGASVLSRMASGLLSATQWICLVTVLVVLWLPFILCIVFAFGVGIGRDGATLAFVASAVKSSTIRLAVFNSMVVAITTACVTTCLAVMASRLSFLRSGAWWLALVSLPVFWPADVQALSLQQILTRMGAGGGGLLPVIVCHVAWLLPFSVATVSLAYRAIPVTLLRAGVELGCGGFRFFRVILVPLARGGAYASLALSGLLSLTELRRGWQLGGSEPLLSVKVFGGLQAGMVGEGPQLFAVAAGVVLFAGFTAGILMLKLLQRQRQD